MNGQKNFWMHFFEMILKLLSLTDEILVMNTSKQVKVAIERGTDGTYSAYIPDNKLPFGCIGEGNSVAQAKEDFMAGVQDMKRIFDREGKNFPAVEFRFCYDTSSFLNYYASAFSLAGLERITGINQRQLSHYANGVRKPSPNTIAKIEKSLKEFAAELSQVTFL